MAKLERPKGYSRKLWSELERKIKTINRFVREKTKTGATVKNVPNVQDVYTKEGRKNIREWSAKKQWETTEYVNKETNEILKGTEAKRQWSYDKSKIKEKSAPPKEAPYHDIYEKVLSKLQEIPNERVFRTKQGTTYLDTGGTRDFLIGLLKDLSDDIEYLAQNEQRIANNVESIKHSSKQYSVDYAISELLDIFNKGPLSKEQWDELQGTDKWDDEAYSGEYADYYTEM